jgi:hypothetical protein
MSRHDWNESERNRPGEGRREKQRDRGERDIDTDAERNWRGRTGFERSDEGGFQSARDDYGRSPRYFREYRDDEGDRGLNPGGYGGSADRDREGSGSSEREGSYASAARRAGMGGRDWERDSRSFEDWNSGGRQNAWPDRSDDQSGGSSWREYASNSNPAGGKSYFGGKSQYDPGIGRRSYGATGRDWTGWNEYGATDDVDTSRGWNEYGASTAAGGRGRAFGDEGAWNEYGSSVNRGAASGYGSPRSNERELGGSTGRERQSTFERSEGRFRGRGPQGYTRADDRIYEDLCERLTDHGELDASSIEVRVEKGEVHLSGNVDSRHAKRLAEDLAEDITGVQDVHNEIRVNRGTTTSESEKK